MHQTFGIALLAMSLAVPASAATMQAVYTGTVDYGTDYSGVFGAAGSDLTGLNYTATYVYNSTGPLTYTDANTDGAYGGTNYSTAPQTYSAKLRINGVTFSFDTSFYSYAYVFSDLASYTQLNNQVYDGTGNHYGNFFNYLCYSAFGTPDVSATVDADNSGVCGSGSASNYNYDSGTGSYTNNFYASMTSDHLKVTQVSAVPVPAAGAFLLAGLAGLVGLKRRKAGSATLV